MLNEKINETFVGSILINLLHCAESYIYPLIISDKKAVINFYKEKTGFDLDLKSPETFSEKMNWYKLNVRMPLMVQCADKYAVREYVKECGYEECLNEIYGVYNSVFDINIDNLPERFVLKAAHGSHMNIIVKEKNDYNWLKEKIIMWTWLHQNIYWGGREWCYKDIPKRIIAEKYLEDESGELRDYKFFCFNGEPCYLQYDIGRFNNKHYRNYYDMSLKLLSLSDDVPNNNEIVLDIPRDSLTNMIEIARKLSKPFQFVRTDFYYVKNKIYFGELTFYHNGGITWFNPPEYDIVFGEKWKIDK